MSPGASREGAKERCGIFLRHAMCKNSVSSIEVGMGMKGQIMYNVRRTMPILNIINSVSRSSKCTEIVGGWGAPDPTGKITAFSQTA